METLAVTSNHPESESPPDSRPPARRGDWCVITDIDGTLLGETETTLALRRILLEEREQMRARGQRLYWVIATGRGLESCREVLLEQGFQLGDFDALVTSVGAELRIETEPDARSTYQGELARSGFNSTLVHECLAGLEMQLQPEEEQHVHKVSYWVQDHADLRQQVHTALAALPFETQVGFSHDSYLDVAPINGAKGGAVAHLLARWGLAPSSAVAAGDSGNDLSMLNREWHAIVVGNGHGELDMLRERSNVFFASRRHAGGILEGLLALGFLQR